MCLEHGNEGDGGFEKPGGRTCGTLRFTLMQGDP